jgi:hypothetical protein
MRGRRRPAGVKRGGMQGVRLSRNVTAGLWLVCGAGADDSVRISSGPAQVTLLEPYTSQGCCSCPLAALLE